MNVEGLLEDFRRLVESLHSIGREATEGADRSCRPPMSDLLVKLDCVLERCQCAAVVSHANRNQSGHGQRRCLRDRLPEFAGKCETFVHRLKGLHMTTTV